jgi:hypothetical protein
MFNLKTNPKRIILAIILSVVIFLLIFFIIKNPGTPGKDKVCYKNYCFEVELAKTDAERNQGLMFREKLDSDKGMLFIFDREGDYPFWMKNTLIPLDIIWINEKKEVVFISENAQPCEKDPCPSINPGKNAKYVLEVNGGTSQKMGLNIGNTLNFKFSSCILCDIN